MSNAPDWLDETGKAIYLKLAPQLGDLSEGKALTLAHYADVASLYRQLRDQLLREGMTVPTGNGSGGRKANPLIGAVKQYADACAKQARLLDLVDTVEAEPDDEFASWQGAS